MGPFERKYPRTLPSVISYPGVHLSSYQSQISGCNQVTVTSRYRPLSVLRCKINICVKLQCNLSFLESYSVLCTQQVTGLVLSKNLVDNYIVSSWPPYMLVWFGLVWLLWGSALIQWHLRQTTVSGF